jgi:hypothetical protein
MNRTILRATVRFLLIGAGLVFAAVSCVAQDLVEDPVEACAATHLKQTVIVEGYTFKTYRSGDYDANNCLKVIENGKVIFRRTMAGMQGYTLGQPEDKERNVPGISNGTDITGRGRPDMIVSFWSGGAHCCSFLYIFELEPKFRLIQTLNMLETDQPYFAELDEDRHYYLIAEDWTFADWTGRLVSAPRAPIVLKPVDSENGIEFHLALDKMRQSAPEDSELDGDLQTIKKCLEEKCDVDAVDDPLWGDVMRLIYSGRSDLAWAFLDKAGPEVEQSLVFFCSLLKASPYWPDLAPGIQNLPPTCAKAKPDRKRAQLPKSRF